MRLAVVSPFVDRRHGTERAIAELLERLAKTYGCEIHLYSQRVEDIALTDSQSKRAENSGAIIWRRVPSVPGPHIMRFIVWMLLNGFLRRWDALFGGNSFDVVLSPGINCLHPDAVIVHALFHRLKYLSQGEKLNPAARSNFFRRTHRLLYYRLLTSLERRVYTNSRVTLAAVSARTSDLLEQYFHRNDVRVIPNGVDTTYFSSDARLALREQARERRGIRRDEFVLLLVGNDWSVKGLITVLEAMAALSNPSLRLIVVGNDDAEPFQTIAGKLGVEQQCLWESPRSDVIDFYAAADVYVSPSREDSFGLPVAEAMACGLPVITSAFAGVADCVHDGLDGFVLRDPSDAQALALLVERLHGDSQLRNAVAEAAAKTILAWTWDRNAAAVWQLLQDAQARRNLRS
ncbi:MAG: glycosyltransferase family 4 protein [Candidatus Acidiferrum sp.]